MHISIDNGSFVSVNELNQIFDQYIESKNNKNIINKIEITFLKKIKEIDIVFIAGLILFHKNENISFSITNNYQLTKDNNKYIIEHYLEQYTKLYKVDYGRDYSEKESEGDSYFSNLCRDKKYDDRRQLIASNKFAPILFINEETISNIFDEKDTLDHNWKKMKELYIAVFSIESNAASEKYFNSEFSILHKLKKCPPIYAFVMAILYQHLRPFVRSTERGINPVSYIENLFQFTQEYVDGLHELAKNIVQHSKNNKGMITIRSYKTTSKDEMVTNIDPKKRVLETYVFDYGSQGIIDTLKITTKKNINPLFSSFSEMYKEDLNILNKNYHLRNFIKPDKEHRLFQQIYRVIAHLGLMKFYQLIESNNGNVASRTTGEDNEYMNTHDFQTPMIKIGTSYFFTLPFNEKLHSLSPLNFPHLPQDLMGTQQTTESSFEMLNYDIKNKINECNESKNLYYIHNIDLDEIDIKDRNDETALLKNFQEPKELNEKNIYYVAVNMKNVTLSPSSLLRFFAYLSETYKNKGILIYNLKNELYVNMLEDNQKFIDREIMNSTEDKKYWYEYSAILIYTYIEWNSLNQPDKKNIQRFHFADILYGRSEHEYMRLNNIISDTIFNSTTILKGKMGDQVKQKAGTYKKHECVNCYFCGNALKSFDVLLYDEYDEISIFQRNLTTLLQQEMKISL